MGSFRATLLVLVFSLVLILGHLFPEATFAQSVQNNVYGPGTDDVVTLSFAENIFKSILSIMIRLIGIGSFIMLLIGSLQYLFSGGNQEGTAKARTTISWAVGGLAMVFAAWFILLFISRLTQNQGLLQFQFWIEP